MTSSPARSQALPGGGLNGWVEAAIFAAALSVLNVAYALGHQLGAHPVAFIAHAMPAAALALLLSAGVGPNWRPIIRHPLSWAIGIGIIVMEATYFMMVRYVSPADASLLVRLNVPISALLGAVVFSRPTSLRGLLGHLVVVGCIAWYVPAIDGDGRWMGVALGLACGLIMSTRWVAAEMHPWNRAAKTIVEKMSLTGLVLAVTSGVGLAILLVLMSIFSATDTHADWLPTPTQLFHPPTIAIAWFSGALVITTMQYLGFSTVVKIGAENFVATTALIPLVTVVLQVASVALGILQPIRLDWSVIPSMLGVGLGVMIVIWAGRQGTSKAE